MVTVFYKLHYTILTMQGSHHFLQACCYSARKYSTTSVKGKYCSKKDDKIAGILDLALTY